MTFSKIEPLEARIAPATLAISGVSVSEGNSGKTAATFTVTLSEDATEEITVDFATGDGTATAGGLFPDYEAQSGTLTFAIGESSKEITVQVLGELIAESDENFTVTLSNPSGTTTIDTDTATGTIQDDGDTLVGVAISNAADRTEGVGVTSIFTVTLSQAITGTATVTFATGATGDTAKAGPGLFTDYVAKTGTLTFTAGGPLSQDISVTITDDIYKEATEQFTMKLTGATGAALSATPSAIGRILNDGDTDVGLHMDDIQTVEGNVNKVITLRPTLSGPLAADLVLTMSTQNGTAVSGADFTGGTPTTLTIAAGQTTGDFNVTIIGDTVFEASESFFVNLSGAPAGVVVINDHPIVPAAQATARVDIFNDDSGQITAQKVQWIDVDGDLVTMSVSRGQLPLSNTTLFTFVKSGTVGGQQLTKLDLSSFGTTFFGASITITATKQAGFPNATDGLVDVGFIQADVFDPDELNVVRIDLGRVFVDGDLAKITAGDRYSTPAISRLEVNSLGARGATTLPSGETFESKILGPISTVIVKQNLEGYLHVIGSEFGTISTLKIGGELKGGTADNSGRVAVSGRLANATIGKIVGGSGASSGLINGLLGSTAAIGNITVLGDVVGGSGQVSGAIIAPRIGNVSIGSLIGGTAQQSGIVLSQSTMGNVTLTGDLIGGSAEQSGQFNAAGNLGAVKIGGKITGGGGADSGTVVSGGNIASLKIGTSLEGGAGAGSGSVRAAINRSGQATGFTGNLGAVTIGENAAHDSIKGGTGANSGRIDILGNLTSFTSAGSVHGGAGGGSGGLSIGGSISKLTINGSLLGGDSTASAFLNLSGFISTLRLKSATIAGDIRSGVNGGGGIASSGAIRADIIDVLIVRGDLVGNSPAANLLSPVIISSAGTSGNLAIKSLTVLGDARFAEILAGYNGVATASNPRGTATSGDASIGTVVIGGDVLGVNIVAGGRVGADLRFGSADDTAIFAASGVGNDPRILSKIASVVIKGAVLANPTGAANSYGVVAQTLGIIKLGPTATLAALQSGAGNDRTPISLGVDTNFHALELAVP